MIKSILRSLIIGAAAAAVTAMVAGPAFAQKTKITVYTALENDQLGPYKKAFEAANPDVEIAWVRDSTGVMTARILAEKDNPRADVIWGLARRASRCSIRWACSKAYTPKGADQAEAGVPQRQEPDDLDRMDAWLAVMCYNTVEAARRICRSRRPGPISPSPSTRTRS